MLDPIVLLPQIPADLRMVMILLAGPFGGPLAVLACGASAAAFRAYEGGPGVLSGLVSIGIAIPISIIFARQVRTELHKLKGRHFLGLGMLSSLSLISALFLPVEFQLRFLMGPAAPIVLATVIGVGLLGTLLTRELRRIHAEEQVRHYALTDPLTRLPNRRALDEELPRMFSRAKRQHQPLTVLFLDIDHFKRINDTFGHEAGDLVLRGVADILRGTIRGGDLAGRYGGEEFVLLLPDTPIGGGVHQGERIRRAIESTPIMTPVGSVSVTASLGAASTNEAIDRTAQLLRLADESLLRAKEAGRNRVEIAEDETGQETELHKLARSVRGRSTSEQFLSKFSAVR